MWTKATWKKGNKEVHGEWHYNWASDRFTIVLNETDRITGRRLTLSVTGDTPEFNGFKIQKKEVVST